jgi:monothiol bacilliredoxin
MFGIFTNKKQNQIWETLANKQTFEKIMADSHHQPVIIFKHSYRCSISRMAKNRLEREWEPIKEASGPYLVDVLGGRPVSQFIEQFTGIRHESPQVIIFKQEKVVFNASHSAISFQRIISKLNHSY